MAALTKQRTSGSRRFIDRDFRPLAANAKVYPGALACVIVGGGTSSGYYKQGAAGATLIAIGRFTGLGSVQPGTNGVLDNTGGADGAISAEVEFFNSFYIFLLNNDAVSAVVVADRGSGAYILDDQTATHASQGNGIAGVVYDVTAEGVWLIPQGQEALVPLQAGAVQSGTATLVAGTIVISANITASSRIFTNMKDPGAGSIADFAAFDVPAANRVVGPASGVGAFTVNAINGAAAALINTAVCTFDWLVVG